MATLSAGLLLFRFESNDLEVLLVHPGGPSWAKKDLGAWSIPKGECEAGEDTLAAAEREFAEEMGAAAPPGPRIELGTIAQPSGKRVIVWALEGTFDVADLASNKFEMQWPPRSGKTASFPEVDRAEWMSLPVARTKLSRGQLGFLDRLLSELAVSGRLSRQ